jgi:hypothetical protein
MIVLGALVAVGLMLLLLLRSTAGSMPWILIAVGALVLILIPVSLFFVRRSDDEGKGKRDLEGRDLLSVIDRLVDDVDDDEAAYLRRRLDEREAKRKDDLTVSLDDLLDQRADDRQDR